MKDLWTGKVKKIGQEITNQEKQIHQIRDSINKFDQEKENSAKEISTMGGKIATLETEIDKNNKLIQG
jgi:chromosome segregation ATPase